MSKVAKHRPCPAVQREISAAECGENRGSKYACPASCPHNPFAPVNYSQLLELEKQVDKKSLTWMEEHATDRDALDRAMRHALNARTPHELHALFAWRILFQTDAQGRTCAHRWEEAGFPGLKNDER